jgi:hypothetical protein
MSDSDESLETQFGYIREQLKEIDFPVPARPLELARKENKPALAVLMQPYSSVLDVAKGCLETLLIPALNEAHPRQTACIDDMFICSGVDQWEKKNARDKAKVRCLISTVYKKDPMHGLHLCFSQDIGLIPLNSRVFDKTSLVLQHFAEWSESGIKSWDEWAGSSAKAEKMEA